MTLYVTKATPIHFIKGKKVKSCRAGLTNHTRSISHHITPLVINALRSGHTYAHTYRCANKSNFKANACLVLKLGDFYVTTWLIIAHLVTYICIGTWLWATYAMLCAWVYVYLHVHMYDKYESCQTMDITNILMHETMMIYGIKILNYLPVCSRGNLEVSCTK